MMDIPDNRKLEALGLEFLNASRERRQEICAEFSVPPSQNDKPIWDYILRDFRGGWHVGDPNYSREKCLNDLALLFILHDDELDPGLDPRDIGFALFAVSKCQVEMDLFIVGILLKRLGVKDDGIIDPAAGQ